MDRAAEVQERSAGQGSVVVVRRSADSEIAEPVSIDVAAGSHVVAVERAVNIGLTDPIRRCGKSGRRTEIEKSRALIDFTVVVKMRADDDVRVTVSIRVAGRADRHAEMAVGLIDLKRAGRGGCEAGRRTLEHKNATLVGKHIVVVIDADNDIRVSVAVDIARCADGVTQKRVDLFTLDRPRWRRCQPRWGTKIYGRVTFSRVSV
ncbi:MAG TPA: hypothetical protein PK093_09960 [Phycisphaerae bacterium]|nr:hypothetical protein [Phycisphaerae bacterium]